MSEIIISDNYYLSKIGTNCNQSNFDTNRLNCKTINIDADELQARNLKAQQRRIAVEHMKQSPMIEVD